LDREFPGAIQTHIKSAVRAENSRFLIIINLLTKLYHPDSLLKDLKEYFYNKSFYTNSLNSSLYIWTIFSKYLDIIDQLFGHNFNNKLSQIICYLKINWDISQTIFNKTLLNNLEN
jgi:hypothetical protein